MGKPQGNAAPWTWAIPLDAVGYLVVGQGIALTREGKLNAASQAVVAELKPATLHRFPRVTAKKRKKKSRRR